MTAADLHGSHVEAAGISIEVVVTQRILGITFFIRWRHLPYP